MMLKVANEGVLHNLSRIEARYKFRMPGLSDKFLEKLFLLFSHSEYCLNKAAKQNLSIHFWLCCEVVFFFQTLYLICMVASRGKP